MIEGNTTRVLGSILEAIGGTPLVELKRIGLGLGARLLVKCEFMNPSGSIKDRMALRMVEDAERDGLISPGRTTLTEASTGNTAEALAMVSAVKGYRFVARFPRGTATPEKTRPLRRYGADYETVDRLDDDETEPPAGDGLGGATVEVPGRLRCLREEQRLPDHVWLRQYINPANAAAQSDIGLELLEQTGGRIDVFVASIGTGGTFLGIARALRASLPHVRCVAVIPGSPSGRGDPLSPEKEYIAGLSGGLIKEVRDSGITDEIVRLGNQEARSMAYRLSREEGLYCGISSGANVHVALLEAGKPGMVGKNIVTLIVDRGDRNISDEQYIT